MSQPESFPSLYVFNAKAGHGKDTASDKVASYFKNNLVDIKTIRFARVFKNILAKMVPAHAYEKYPDYKNDPHGLLDILKEDHELIFAHDLSFRRVMQVIGNDFIREINPSTHICWEALEMEKTLFNDGFDVIFVASDNRYRNELEYLYGFNQIKDNAQKIDYIRWFVNKNKPNLSEQEVEAVYDAAFSPYPKDLVFKSKFLELLSADLKRINDSKPSVKEWDFNVKNLSKMNKEEAFKMGFVNIFRPIADAAILTGEETEDEMVQVVSDYTGMSPEVAEKIRGCYRDSGLQFNAMNVKKYGFLRTNPNHPSENDLDGFLPEPVINSPLNGEGENELTKFIDSQIRNIEENQPSKKFYKGKRFNISVPASLLIDIEDEERIFKKHGASVYKATLRNINKEGKVLPEGRLNPIFQYVKFINKLLPEESMQIEIGVITRNAPYEARLIHQSLRHHNIEPYFMAFTNGKKRSEFAKQFDVDLVLTHSAKSQKDHRNNGFPAYHFDELDYMTDRIEESPTIGSVISFFEVLVKNKEIKSELGRIYKHFESAGLLDLDVSMAHQKNESLLNQYKQYRTNKSVKDIDHTLSINYSLEAITNDPLSLNNETIALNLLKKDMALSDNVPSNVMNFRFSITTTGAYDKRSVLNYLEHHGVNIEKIEFVDRDDIEKYAKENKINLYIGHDKEQVGKYNQIGIPAIALRNVPIDKATKETLKNKTYRQVFDLDEVVVKDEEAMYKLFSLQFFDSFQRNYVEFEQNKGPMFEYFYKIGRVSRYLKKNPSDEINLEVTVLTSRGGDYACMRFMNFMERNSLYMDESLFLGGLEKTNHLLYLCKQGGMVLFMDDHPVHIDRINDHIMNNPTKNIAIGHCIAGINSKELTPEFVNEEKRRIKGLISAKK